VLCAYGIIDVAHSAEDFLLWFPDRARPRLQSIDLVIRDEPDCVQQVLDLHRHVTGKPYALQLAQQLGHEPEWPGDCQLLPVRTSDHCSPADASVVLAPGSGSAKKCWPPEHWLALARRLAATRRNSQVVVGRVELERGDLRAWPWPVGTTFLIEAEPVRLAKLLENAPTFVGNDSGTTHLAAMLGVPTIAVFLATDPSIWAPVGVHVRV